MLFNLYLFLSRKRDFPKIILMKLTLFYQIEGVEDHVRCFACDGGLRRWDPGDDPWVEHCRWFPACPYAREQKGDEFIALVQASLDDEQVNISLGKMCDNKTNLWLIFECRMDVPYSIKLAV